MPDPKRKPEGDGWNQGYDNGWPQEVYDDDNRRMTEDGWNAGHDGGWPDDDEDIISTEGED